MTDINQLQVTMSISSSTLLNGMLIYSLYNIQCNVDYMSIYVYINHLQNIFTLGFSSEGVSTHYKIFSCDESFFK